MSTSTHAHTPYVPDSKVMPEYTWSAVIVGALLGIVFGASSLYLVLKVGMTVSASIPVAVLSITLFRLFSKLTGTRRTTILENNMVQTVGSSAKTVFTGFGIAAAYKVLMSGFKLWNSEPERHIPFYKGAAIAGEVSPELVGVGYIIGTRISCVMVAGGILASWVLIPAIKLFGDGLTEPLFPATKLIRDMSPAEVWKSYILYIGAGAVAAGGIISLFQALPTIVSSLKSGLKDILAGGGKASTGAKSRHEDDLPNWVVVAGSALLVLVIAATPSLGLGFGVKGILGALLIVLFGFLFVTVSSRLTGEIGSSSNPISGMTVATLLLTCLIFVLMSKLDPNGGWVGKGARLTALSIAAIVCIAASNGGTTSQDLKTGFLVGATPRYQQLGLLVGALSSALVIGLILILLNDASTVYAKRDYPSVYAPMETLTESEPLKGPDAAVDSGTYKVWHVADGEVPGVPQGKYLVDEATKKIKYVADPGINGTETVRLDGTHALKYNAPKARLMSLIIDGILTDKLPWGLVLLGVGIALVLELCAIPSLPFAVGVYLPLASSTPIFVGGVIRWVADKWTKKSEAEGDMSPGVLFSSGYIAGGAIAGIILAMLSLSPKLSADMDLSETFATVAKCDLTSVAMFGVISVLLLLVGGEKWLADKPSKKHS